MTDNNKKAKEDIHIYKSHNKTLLLYNIVFVIKYRRKVITKKIEESIGQICTKISETYEIRFLEAGLDEDHIHLLTQSIPKLSVSEIVKRIKGILARELFLRHPEIKRYLWGGNLWTEGYYVNTIGQYSNKEVIAKYIQNQGKKEKDYKKIFSQQMCFDFDRYELGDYSYPAF